jgi:hypothetical protein
LPADSKNLESLLLGFSTLLLRPYLFAEGNARQSWKCMLLSKLPYFERIL